MSMNSLNDTCNCITLDRGRLDAQLPAPLGETHAALISSVPFFVAPADVAAMARLVATIERLAKTPAYHADSLADASEVARFVPAARSVLMGYDFHLGPDGPKLIEINTNAGGALINAIAAGAQTPCCTPVTPLLTGLADPEAVEQAIFDSFYAEWRAARGDRPLRTIAIVDEAPAAQFLYPEFLLFKALFERHGLKAMIASPDQLADDGTALLLDGDIVDLVYNRTTDFAFATPPLAALRSAYLADRAVVTPHPRAHALLADKRNLARLTDPARLDAWGVAAEDRAILANGIPRTIEVGPANAAALWSKRADFFFKPFGGYGSRAAYRGDKITRKVWAEIIAGGYIAQSLVPPSTRTVRSADADLVLKADVRCYTYDGNIQLMAARLYNGQTTNMRTVGGGFAPVLSSRLATSAESMSQRCCV